MWKYSWESNKKSNKYCSTLMFKAAARESFVFCIPFSPYKQTVNWPTVLLSYMLLCCDKSSSDPNQYILLPWKKFYYHGRNQLTFAPSILCSGEILFSGEHRKKAIILAIPLAMLKPYLKYNPILILLPVVYLYSQVSSIA